MWCACVGRYVLWEAEDKGLLLPYACRMGCCTACAVKIKEGEMYQPQVCSKGSSTSIDAVYDVLAELSS